MQTNVHGSMRVWLRDTPLAYSDRSAIYREARPFVTSDWRRARATVLAGFMLLGFAGLACVGLISLAGAVGFGIWQLWR